MTSLRMRLLSALIQLAMAGAAHATTDPVAETSKLGAVDKTGSPAEARAQQKGAISEGRKNGTIGTNEYQRQQNPGKALPGNHESRQAERQAQRNEVKRQAAAGEIPTAGDEWVRNGNEQKKGAGTHASRQAERRSKRAELKDANQRGEIPVTSEAAVSLPR